MQKKEIRLTLEGYRALEKELVELSGKKREELAAKIELARSYGDLSENSEYDDAKNEQAQVEARIADIEVTLKNAVIIDDSLRLKVYNTLLDEEVVYHIVSSSEADPENGKISDESPIGSALLNRKEGDEVMVDLPNGTQVKIVVLEVLQ